MTSSNGNIFRVTGHSCGEFTGQRPVMRSFDVFFDLRLNKLLSKQSPGWWFETLSCPLWRHCNDLSLHDGDVHRGHSRASVLSPAIQHPVMKAGLGTQISLIRRPAGSATELQLQIFFTEICYLKQHSEIKYKACCTSYVPYLCLQSTYRRCPTALRWRCKGADDYVNSKYG